MPSKKVSIVASSPVKTRSGPAPQKGRKRPPTQVKAQEAYNAPTNSSEVVNCVLNPYLLTEFLFGYFARGLTDSDAVYDASIVSGLVYTTLTLFNGGDIQSLGVGALPREIVDLYYSLRASNFGPRTFYCNIQNLSGFLKNVSSAGWSSATGLADILLPTSASTTYGGFYNCNLTPSLITGNAMRDVFAQYGNAFKMVPVTDSSRASYQVFSFDVATPLTAADIRNNTVNVYAMAGYSNANPVFLTQCSNVALEYEVRNPSWMFYLRLCTPSDVNGSSYNRNDVTRLPRYSHPVTTFPSVIGHQLGSNKNEYTGSVQLKLVPLVATLTAIVAKLEAAISACNQKAAWTASFTKQEVILLAFGLFRAAADRYGGAAYGVSSIIGAPVPTVNTLETMFDSSGYKLFQCLRIPQIINDCLQAQKVYSDRNGVLLPCYTRVPDLNAVVPTLSYSGSGVTGIPAESSSITYRYYSGIMGIIAKYKVFEAPLAGICRLTVVTSYGNSLLDTTICRDGITSSAANVNLISSRRPLDSVFIMNALLKLPFVSYDYCQANTITLTSPYGGEDRTRVYSQRYSVVLAGVDSVTNVTAMSISDGFVPLGASANNVAPSFTDAVFDPNDPWSVGRPLPVPRHSSLSASTSSPTISPAYRSMAYRAFSETPGLKSMTYGNYGGPGYTAGSRDSSKWLMKDGQYIVPPLDLEDAIYKRHDEAIHNARGDVAKEVAADDTVYEELSQFQDNTGQKLSMFGTVARAYFKPRRSPVGPKYEL